MTKILRRYLCAIVGLTLVLTSCSSNKQDNRSYDEQRNSIVAENSYKLGSQLQLNEHEKALDERIKNLIKAYEENVNDFEYAPGNSFYNFVDGKGKDEIVNVPLYKLIKIMPKGGNLHVHTTATFGATDFYNFVIDRDDVYVATKEFTNSKGTKVLEGALIVSEDGKVEQGFDQLKSAISSGKISKDRLLSLWTIDAADQNIPHIWDEFNNVFSRVSGVAESNKVLYKEFYKTAFLEQLNDKINHVELRCGITEFDGDKTGEVALKVLRDVYYELKKQNPDFTLKVIMTTSKDKKKDVAKVKDFMKNVVNLKEKVKDEYDPNKPVDFIVGFDLVNAEDDGHQLYEYVKYINEARNEGAKLNAYFHAGESVLANSQNLIDAYLLDTKRVGHGLNLYRFPDLMNKMKDKQIALEVCPVSNQLLRYTYDLRTHPAVEYLKRDIPMCLCSDDPLVFKNSGLSFDFFEAIAGWHLGVAQIKQLCMNSIKYSAATDTEKDTMMKTWEKQWNDFVESNYQTQEADSKAWF